MKSVKHVFVWIFACCLVPAPSGCGPGGADDLPRQTVWGKVTFDGAPLAQGTIAFRPLAALPTPGMVSISGGVYSIPKAQGLVPGSYEVSILSSENQAPAEKADEPPGQATRRQTEAVDGIQRAKTLGKSASSQQLIPSRYNTATTLTVEVKEGASNSFDFALTSAEPPKK